MYDLALLFLGGVLGFAHAARSWLALRMKDGKRCVPKFYLWHGVRNLVVSLAVFVALLSIGSASSTGGTAGTEPFAAVGVLFAAAILMAIGFGVGNGLSNVFGGTLSYVTEGPNQPTPSTDDGSPTTDKYGQLKEN